MVKINNQRKAFLDMLAWSEGTDNGRQKTRNHGYNVIVGGELFTDYSDHLANLSRQTQTQINRRRTLPASFLLVGCLLQAAWPERLSPKSQDAVALQQIKERGAYLWLIVVISVAIDRCSNIWASLPGAGYGCSSIRLTAWLQNSKKRRMVREIDVWAESPRLSPLWLSASSSACHGLLIITVITPLPKPSATKNARELKLANAAIRRHADASAWCCCARCKIHEGVSWC